MRVPRLQAAWLGSLGGLWHSSFRGLTHDSWPSSTPCEAHQQEHVNTGLCFALDCVREGCWWPGFSLPPGPGRECSHGMAGTWCSLRGGGGQTP